MSSNKDLVALEALTERLKTYAYRPGTHLKRKKLVEELGIGDTPVTIALKIAHSEGLLDHIARNGYFVRMPTRENLLGLYRGGMIQAYGVLCLTIQNGLKGVPPITNLEPLGDAQPKQKNFGVHLADASYNLFHAIARLSGDDITIKNERNRSLRLHFVRTFEWEYIPETHNSLRRMTDALAEKNYSELLNLTQSYYRQRIRSIDVLSDQAFLRSMDLTSERRTA